MYDDAAGKVAYPDLTPDSAVAKKTAAPDPIRNRRKDEQHPECGKREDKQKAHPLDEGTDDQCGRDDREGHLKEKEHVFRNGSAQGVRPDPGEEALSQPAPNRVSVPESNRIAKREPQERHNKGGRKTLQEDRQNVRRANQSAIE